MNIFYYSVHHILEDDEIRLFQELGHNVFSFGYNRKNGAIQPFRPSIAFNPAENLIFDSYEASGGTFGRNDEPERTLPVGFEGHFSAFVIMHEASFILRFWPRIKHKLVIWRTIGQGVDQFDEMLAGPRSEGLKIIRYSPKEIGFHHYCGEDATIRFFKDPRQYSGWIGNIPKIVTFSNWFANRYPAEAAAYAEIAKSVPCALGGLGNELLPQSIGFATFEDQLDLYRAHRAYLYISGLEIPYTLNFIEAWMTGIPVIVYAPIESIGQYFEIDSLLTDGVDGFICGTPEEAARRCRELIEDVNLARRIGAAGRETASRYFGKTVIAGQWKKFFVEHSLNR